MQSSELRAQKVLGTFEKRAPEGLQPPTLRESLISERIETPEICSSPHVYEKITEDVRMKEQ